jgi:hypothetical protein
MMTNLSSKLALILLIGCEAYFIDKNLQRFHQDYRRFKGKTLQVVDRSFFHFYKALNLSLFDTFAPVVKSHQNWIEMCKTLRKAKLGNETLNHLNEICYKINNLFDIIHDEHENGLLSFFYRDLTDDSSLRTIAKSLFAFMELQMQDMWKIYKRNETCIASLLSTYLPSFEPIVDNICFMSNQTISNISTIFTDSRALFSISTNYIDGFVQKLMYCQKSKQLGECVMKGVRHKVY